MKTGVLVYWAIDLSPLVGCTPGLKRNQKISENSHGNIDLKFRGNFPDVFEIFFLYLANAIRIEH